MSKSPGQLPLRQENDGSPPLQSAAVAAAAAAAAAAIASRGPLQKTSSKVKEVHSTKAFGFPLRSLIRDPDEQIPPPPISELSEAPAVNSPDGLPKENSLDSPLRSPVRRLENQAPLPIPQTNKETPFLASPFRSLMRGADSKSSTSSQQPLSTHNENSSRSPAGDGTVENAGSPMLQTGRSTEKPFTMDRMAAPPATMSAKVGRGVVNGMRVESGVLRWPAMKKAELGLRILEVVLCLISFSVMAADKTTGWAGDSFDRYQEFRYCISMNVIAFVYSVFQVFAQFYHKMKKRSIIDPPLTYYLDFSMDQVLAYLLMSASSSAAARNDDWISMFGNDKFTDMINGSIAMSFLAFLAFAMSSIISADKLFSWKP
ncbi:CASP-like protein 4A3 [Dendrobium catenatum]|uniref:CASP-like protein n=1 Tax=Dendrobium catenatum TaxID=906689 RepID=A0A2I0WNX6_9ASPA|nr:CASP-like protein 4A3 [Dendrobium catenatum]PKU77370.1 CASP-like protein [Dendrobium catenatum]